MIHLLSPKASSTDQLPAFPWWLCFGRSVGSLTVPSFWKFHCPQRVIHHDIMIHPLPQGILPPFHHCIVLKNQRKIQPFPNDFLGSCRMLRIRCPTLKMGVILKIANGFVKWELSCRIGIPTDFGAKGLRSQHVWIVDETCKCTLQRLFKTKAEVSLQSEEICKCKTSTEFADLCWPGDVATEASLWNFRPFTLHILFWIFGTSSSHLVLAT